ncbi:MAG: S8 family serine peptidase [Proteobacteria bacterium]|nr:S8 family serine peptidase [Pseudomonadota bacterium]
MIPDPADQQCRDAYAHDSVIVKFRSSHSVSAFKRAMTDLGGSIEDVDRDGIYDRFARIGAGELALLELDASVTVEQALARLSKNPDVEYAEPNYLIHITEARFPNDASFDELWGLHNTGQTGGTTGADVRAPDAWSTSVGSRNIIAGIIDTGVDYTHPDLSTNMWVNPNEIPENGIDDDGNGYIDDIHGINAITGSGDPMDDHGHGTHVAGTVGATGNNDSGVVGVNWEVSMVAMKFLPRRGGGKVADAIACINYALDLKQQGVDIRMLNNSWGGVLPTQALEEALVAASDADILLVASAGNLSSNNDESPDYPSSYEIPNLLAVAATDHNDELSPFSSYGSLSVDLGAPGSAILSTMPDRQYGMKQGTSMATPHVTGAAALALSVNHTLTAEELKIMLMDSGAPVAALHGRTASGRRLDVASMVEQVPPPSRFHLRISPAGQVINQEETAVYDIEAAVFRGFSDPVSLDVVARPELDATMRLAANPLAAGATTTLRIETTRNTIPGEYSLTITGSSGSLVLSRNISLTVRPFGTVVRTLSSTDTPLDIPDNLASGVISTITGKHSIEVDHVTVVLTIEHTYISDLIVTLTSPAGTQIALHDRLGGGSNDIFKTYYLSTEFNSENFAGDWVLSVSDHSQYDSGRIASWDLIIRGVALSPIIDLETASATRQVKQGDSATYAMDVKMYGSSSREVSLAVEDQPALDISLSSNQVIAPDSAVLTVETSPLTPPGTYPLRVTGTHKDQSESIELTLDVRPLEPVIRSYHSVTLPNDVPQSDPSGVVDTISVTDSLQIDTLAVEVKITHPAAARVTLILTSPSGTRIVLRRHGDCSPNVYEIFRPVQFSGENSAGQWALRVSDEASFGAGTLDSWSLTVTGMPLD